MFTLVDCLLVSSTRITPAILYHVYLSAYLLLLKTLSPGMFGGYPPVEKVDPLFLGFLCSAASRWTQCMSGVTEYKV